MRRFRRLNQKGDTIVEVLVVLAVLGLAFGISYATANKSLAHSRNAEEHSQALGQITNQIELLRDVVAAQDNSVFIHTSAYCLKPDHSMSATFAKPSSDARVINLDTYPADCVDDLYHKSITYTPGTAEDLFEFRIVWDGPGSTGRQQETITYKIHKAN